MADREIQNLHSNKQPLDKTQSSKLCQLRVNLKEKKDMIFWSKYHFKTLEHLSKIFWSDLAKFPLDEREI